MTRRVITPEGLLAAIGIAIALSLISGACHKPNLTPVSNIADYGQKAIATVNQIAKVTAALPIADERKAPIMISANMLQQSGVKLADALDAYRFAAAANRAAAAARVNAVLDEIDKVLRSLKLPPETVYGRVVQLLADLAGFLSHVRLSVGVGVARTFSIHGGVA